MAPAPDPILQLETDRVHRSGHADPVDPPHQAGSTDQADNQKSTFYQSLRSCQARLRSNRPSVSVPADTNQDIVRTGNKKKLARSLTNFF